MAKKLEFFFDYASPYSYLASTQIEALCVRTGAELVWRPFLLGGVFKATGNVAPATVFAKAQYLFKDLNDWCRFYGLPPLVLPDNFPLAALTADRLGLVAQEVGKLPAFTRAMYESTFVQGRDPNSHEVLAEVASEAGLDPLAALQRAGAQEIKDALRKNTDEAVERGAFGAPTFFVNGDDQYVGNDRLQFVEAALRKL